MPGGETCRSEPAAHNHRTHFAFATLTGPNHDISARYSGRTRLITEPAGQRETTESLGERAAPERRCRVARVSRRHGAESTNPPTHAQTVAFPWDRTKKAEGLVSAFFVNPWVGFFRYRGYKLSGRDVER